LHLACIVSHISKAPLRFAEVAHVHVRRIEIGEVRAELVELIYGISLEKWFVERLYERALSAALVSQNEDVGLRHVSSGAHTFEQTVPEVLLDLIRTI